MAYLSKELSVLAYANGFTLWDYQTPDAIGDVLSEGYFLDASDMLRAGDILVVKSNTDDEVQAHLVLVASNKDSDVQVKSMGGA